MARALMDSTIFVVFISTSYANDRSCTDIFKYAKLTLGKPMVVIVVGEDNFSWRKTNLGLLLPDVVSVIVIYLSLCLSVCLSACLFVCLSVCLSVSLSEEHT